MTSMHRIYTTNLGTFAIEKGGMDVGMEMFGRRVGRDPAS
jgi:hypothetical protein